MRVKVYLSDDGFGHLVRQEAIIKQLIERANLDITIQTKNKVEVARQKFGNKVKYIKKFNNIETKKHITGYLNRRETKKYFIDYLANSQKFIEEEVKDFNYDFVISDTVPEAHAIAKMNSVPSFGIFHFDWAWFCSKTFPDLEDTTRKMAEYYKQATQIYLPPLAPQDIIRTHKNISTHVPFIINAFDDVNFPKTGKKNVLIMDNGTSTLSEIIIRNFSTIEKMNDYHFFIPRRLAKQDGNNITRIDGLKNVHSHIPKVDIIVARAGYNTITESIITKVPALFVNEGKNPEVSHNIEAVCTSGLGSSMTVEQYKNNFSEVFENFIIKDYNIIKKNLVARDFKSDGAKIIAEDILQRVGQ
tara:strand:+ start:439 stop:1515 length:1077 start_codon:yes stop_codon:yes gene_type:complete